MKQTQSAWQRFLHFVRGTKYPQPKTEKPAPSTDQPQPEYVPTYEEKIASDIVKKSSTDFVPTRDLLVVPDWAVGLVDKNANVIGLKDVRNVSKVRVGR